MKKLSLVKIGGGVIDEEAGLKEVLQRFAALEGPKILVHGGGKIASQLGEKLGIAPQMVDGRRITDAETLRLVTMVYGGLINKNMVALLQAMGCNAIGLTGADGNLIPAHKRAEGAIDWGFAGDFKPGDIQIATLEKLLEAGLVPVMAPLTHDGQGSILNTNADTIAAGLAIALSASYATELVYCFDKKGVLKDVSDPASLIRKMSKEAYKAYKESGIIAAGMLPKLENAFQALEQGVSSIRLCDSADLNVQEGGTRLCL